MSILKQNEIDQISDTLKRMALRSNQLPKIEIAAWFSNTSDGPQFWCGYPPQPGMQPLYYTSASATQKPVAYKAKNIYELIVTDTSAYRTDLEWVPLYLARE